MNFAVQNIEILRQGVLCHKRTRTIVKWIPALALVFSFLPNLILGQCSNVPSSIPGFIYMGEYNGSKYFCSDDNNNTWHDAINEIASHGGHLVVINDAAENDFIKNNILADFAWIGYTDEDHEGDFDWINGEADGFTYWSSGEPNDQGTSGNHADHTVIRKTDGRWFDRNGNNPYEYVMEIPCSSPPSGGSCTNRTTDGLMALYTFNEGSGIHIFQL